jgi:ribosomal protein S18 acetylase RimI-like enzyme
MHAHEIVVQAADRVESRDLIEALNAAYADYFVPIHLAAQSFERLVTREAIRLEASAVALFEGRVVGMGLLGVRGQRAWIGGMGVVPDLRHQGIGRQIMAYLLDKARKLAIKHIQLEVITQNRIAFNLYQSNGFQTTRRLLVLSGEEHPSGLASLTTHPGMTIEAPDVASLLARLPEIAAVPAPWQRDPESLWQMRDQLDGLSAHRKGNGLLGLCLWSGDDQQAGIYGLHATSQEATGALLGALLARLPSARFSYLNVPDDDPALPMLKSAGFWETIDQYEMHLELNDSAEQ